MRFLFLCLFIGPVLAQDIPSLYDSLLEERNRGGKTPGFAMNMVRSYEPQVVEALLEEHPQVLPFVFPLLSEALVNASQEEQKLLANFHKNLVAARLKRLKDFQNLDRRSNAILFTSLIWHPRRVTVDQVMRQRIFASLKGVFSPEDNLKLKDWFLKELQALPDLSYSSVESLAIAWGLVERESEARRFENPSELVLAENLNPITHSIYFFPSQLVTYKDAKSFINFILNMDQQREIVVVTDHELGFPSRVHQIHPLGYYYSLWPRDPMTFFRNKQNELVILNRTFQQESRENDIYMVRSLVNGLPKDVDQAIGTIRWLETEQHFHNGQILIVGGKVWIDVKSLEKNILKIMGLDRIPVETFDTRSGIDAFVNASKLAAKKLSELYSLPVNFVHPLPDGKSLEADNKLMILLGGTAGLDLDSIVSILGDGQQAKTAMVASVTMGSQLIEKVAEDELTIFADFYQMRGDAASLRQKILMQHQSSRAVSLEANLNLIANHLEKQGLRVIRVPQLFIYTSILRNPSKYPFDYLQISWNNVVLNRKHDQFTAEGFSSQLKSGDDLAKSLYQQAGYQLNLVPTLAESIFRRGGYRCASKHVRTQNP